MEFLILETAVAEVDGVRVGAANIFEEDYEVEGSSRRGARATLAVMGDTPETDFDVRVHVGMRVRIGALDLMVTGIDAPAGRPGTVSLEGAPSP